MFGVTGNAMAAFEMSNVVLVAYEGQHTSPVGNEAYYDLGRMDGSGLTAALDTGINLDDFLTNDWSDIKVGIVGGAVDDTFTFIDTFIFGSDSPGANFFGNHVLFQLNYQSFVGDSDAFGYGEGIPDSKSTNTKKSYGSYTNTFNRGANPGLYGLCVNATGDFGAEVQLGVGSYEIGLYTINGEGTPTLLTTLNLDTTSGNLVLGGLFDEPISNIPVPGAFWLLGSCLLGMKGIRRIRKG